MISYANIATDSYSAAISAYEKALKSRGTLDSVIQTENGKANERLARTSALVSIALSLEFICTLMRDKEGV